MGEGGGAAPGGVDAVAGARVSGGVMKRASSVWAVRDGRILLFGDAGVQVVVRYLSELRAGRCVDDPSTCTALRKRASG